MIALMPKYRPEVAVTGSASVIQEALSAALVRRLGWDEAFEEWPNTGTMHLSSLMN
jgi:hypothetical protein